MSTENPHRYSYSYDADFDDSSSLSSGVSDTLNEISEDFLSSSFSEPVNSALTKAKGTGDVGLKLPVGLSGSAGRKVNYGMDPSGAYKVVSSKAQVKKAEITSHSEEARQVQQWKKESTKAKEFARNVELSGFSALQRDEKKVVRNVPVGPTGYIVSAVGRKPEKKLDMKDRLLTLSPQLNGEKKGPKTIAAFGPLGTRRASTGAPKVNGRVKHESERNGESGSLDRPRTKVKVSGGTQTTSDLQYMPTAGFHSDGEYSSSSLGRKYQQLKSYSLNGPAAAQLSQGVKERILQSPYRKVSAPNDGSPYHYYRERSPRIKPTDGSLSDSPYINYAEIQYASNPYGTPYSWVTRSNYAAPNVNKPTSHLIERTFPRSTKSEKVLGFRDGFHSSQPTSPTPQLVSRLPQSPLNNANAKASPYYTNRNAKDDECHGSSLSLVSSSSSIYSSQEEKHAAEIRKLKRDLTDAQEKVFTLTNQLTTNAHVVAAFEQSLTNMTNRLQQLAATSEQKDSELMGLRKTIDALRQQSVDAGLTVACLQSKNLVRGTSVESVSSLSSACSNASHNSHDKNDIKSKKKGWLRTSFTKAFSRNPKAKKTSDDEGKEDPQIYVTEAQHQPEEPKTEENDKLDTEAVEQLKRQLWEKDMVLTDIRLEALTSAHQLESLKESMTKMRSEIKSLKDDNDRLQKMFTKNTQIENDRRISITEDADIDDTTDVLLIDPLDKECKKVTVSVMAGQEDGGGSRVEECVIGAISVSSRTKWEILDNLVKRIFREFLLRVDPVSVLGINSESILSYQLGEITRKKDSYLPELLPCGYFVGEVASIKIYLKGPSLNCPDELAFHSLVPKSIVQRYISLLTEHRRIILCGPPGTGKTYIAKKLAEYLVGRLGKEISVGNIATFSVDMNMGKDLGGYLAHISEQCESNVSELPAVIILDNLHIAGSLSEVFNGFLSAKYTNCPFIIGTMNQTTNCSTTNLQLHHNFRWVLMANHMEPVKGLLARISRKKLTQVEVETSTRQTRLQQILDWVPKCWTHINKFLETHSSSDVTLGPRLFFTCPANVKGSQTWFSDLWNYTLVSYVVEAVREGLQLYGKRASWQDPTTWMMETYPWPEGSIHGGTLIPVRPEDVGYNTISGSIESPSKKSDSSSQNDPLLSMLLRLQEAANFSSPQQDSPPLKIENIDSALESTL